MFDANSERNNADIDVIWTEMRTNGMKNEKKEKRGHQTSNIVCNISAIASILRLCLVCCVYVSSGSIIPNIWQPRSCCFWSLLSIVFMLRVVASCDIIIVLKLRKISSTRMCSVMVFSIHYSAIQLFSQSLGRQRIFFVTELLHGKCFNGISRMRDMFYVFYILTKEKHAWIIY